MERAAEAAALIAAACADAEKPEDDDGDDPLDKFMEDIAKEVKNFRGNTATIFSTKSNGLNTKGIKQEQLTNNKSSAIKIVTKTVKNEVRTNFDTDRKKKLTFVFYSLLNQQMIRIMVQYSQLMAIILIHQRLKLNQWISMINQHPSHHVLVFVVV